MTNQYEPKYPARNMYLVWILATVSIILTGTAIVEGLYYSS